MQERLKVEQAFHDGGAGGRGASRLIRLVYGSRLSKRSQEYAFELAGPLDGRNALELGCGSGYYTTELARRGAVVWAIDLSYEMAGAAQKRVSGNGWEDSVAIGVMAAECLAFVSEAFDVVFGGGILHHLDLAHALREVRRVLKPGGRAVFIEPLGYNPLLNLYRRLTPGQRTSTERPLRFETLEQIREEFAGLEHREFFLLSLLGVLPGARWGQNHFIRVITDLLCRLDDGLLATFPFLWRFCWITVIRVNKH
jgi:SAM-dependent methyltransferase